MMCDILSEITMHLKTQENITYDKKSQSVETDPEMTQ